MCLSNKPSFPFLVHFFSALLLLFIWFVYACTSFGKSFQHTSICWHECVYLTPRLYGVLCTGPFIVFIDLMRIGDVRVIFSVFIYTTQNNTNRNYPLPKIIKALLCIWVSLWQGYHRPVRLPKSKGSSIIIIKLFSCCCCCCAIKCDAKTGYKLILDPFICLPIAIFISWMPFDVIVLRNTMDGMRIESNLRPKIHSNDAVRWTWALSQSSEHNLFWWLRWRYG